MAVGRIGIFLCLVALVAADTPANCSYEDVKGEWVFSVGDDDFDRTLNCSSFGKCTVQYVRFHLFVHNMK